MIYNKVVCHVKASSSFDDLAREELWEMLEDEEQELENEQRELQERETDQFFARKFEVPQDKM